MSNDNVPDERLLASLPSSITSVFDRNELAVYLSLFRKYDTDGSGTIGSDELLQMLEELDFQDMSSSDCTKLIRELDADNSGQVDFDEFIHLLIMIQDGSDRDEKKICTSLLETLSDETKQQFKQEELQSYLDLFLHFDDDGSESIGAGELKLMLKGLGFSSFSKSDCRALIKDIDEDKNGEICFEEFVTLVGTVMHGDLSELLAPKTKHKTISPDELIDALPDSIVKSVSTADLLVRADLFLQFDDDGGGSIGIVELKEMFLQLGFGMSRSDCQSLLNDIDTDGSGDISFQEFNELIHMMESGNGNPTDGKNSSKKKSKKKKGAKTPKGNRRKPKKEKRTTGNHAEKLEKKDKGKKEKKERKKTRAKNQGVKKNDSINTVRENAQAEIAALKKNIKIAFTHERLVNLYHVFTHQMLPVKGRKLAKRVDAQSFCNLYEMIGIENISVPDARDLMSEIDSTSNGLLLEKMSFEQFCFSVQRFREKKSKPPPRMKVPKLPKRALRDLLLPVPWHHEEYVPNPKQRRLVLSAKTTQGLKWILFPLDLMDDKATRLQCAIRIRQARKVYKKKLISKQLLEDRSSKVIQARIRGKLARAEMENMRGSCVKIQARFRGHRYRAIHAANTDMVKHLVSNILLGFFRASGFSILDTLRSIRIKERRNAFATVVQRFYRRRRKARAILKFLKARRESRRAAALLLQKNIRWFLFRLRFKRIRFKAAQTIQLFFFGVERARKYVAMVREIRQLENDVAVQIQAIARGYIARVYTLARQRQLREASHRAIMAAKIQCTFRGWWHRHRHFLGKRFWPMWRDFIVDLSGSFRASKEIANICEAKRKKVTALKRLSFHSSNVYNKIKTIQKRTKQLERPRRSFKRPKGRYEVTKTLSSPVKSSSSGSSCTIGYNAFAEEERRLEVENDLGGKKKKMRKLRRKIKFLKGKLKMDSERREKDLVKARKKENMKLSQRIVMHARRHQMLKFSSQMVHNVETDRKINKELDNAVPQCTEVLEMALYDTKEEEAQKELEHEESLVAKFEHWGL
jgi:Ca2+-binding EF-hand superfamily protein